MPWDNRKLLLGPLGDFPPALLVIFLLWTLFWTGLALWRAAGNNQRNWFIALLVLNTAGLLEIIYLAFFQKKIKEKKK